MPKTNGGERRVFIDSSVCFAAVLSTTGGSFRVFREAHSRGIVLIVSPYVIEEVIRSLQEKYPGVEESFHSFFLHFPMTIARNPSRRTVQKYLHLLPPEDAPILAAAVIAKATHLLTLDRKHFLVPLKKVALPVEVLTPGDFIQRYF